MKMLTPINEYSRECLMIEVGRKLRSNDVLNALAEVKPRRSVSKYLRSDNRPEFIAGEIKPSLEDTLKKISWLRHSSRKPLWKLSKWPLCHGLSDSKDIVSIPMTEAGVVIEEW